MSDILESFILMKLELQKAVPSSFCVTRSA